jgi:molybdopterin molybdotransferase
VPVAGSGGRAVPLPFGGPAMLRGVAAGGLLAVIPPGGAPGGARVEVVPVNTANG